MEATTLQSPSETLLIVDDIALMTSLFEQQMTKYGYRVLTAGSGQEALDVAAAEGNSINLVVTDMTMPDMDGLSLARELASRLPDVPVLIATGHDLDTSQFDLPNFAGIVRKPYQGRVLAERIREILDRVTLDKVTR